MQIPWALIFSQLNTIKNKNNPKKTIHNKGNISIAKALYYCPLSLGGCMVCCPQGASLYSSHQSCYSCPILWIHYPVHEWLAEGTSRWELRRDSYLARLVRVKKVDHSGSASSIQIQNKKAGFMSVSDVPQSPPVQMEMLVRDQNESWESTVRLKSNELMKGEEPLFRIHRQLVNNK